MTELDWIQRVVDAIAASDLAPDVELALLRALLVELHRDG